MNSTSIIGLGFAGVVTFSCVKHIATGGLKTDYEVFKGRKLVDWLEIIVGDLIALVSLLGCYYLAQSAPKWLKPILNWSWLDLIADSGHSGEGTNQMMAGAKIPFFGVVFVVLLFLNLPRLAESEEYSFRDGTKDWLHAIPRSLGFGLAHMVVGVPLCIGLALSIPGLWFTGQYFRGGVPRSTMAHALYNMFIATGLFVFVLYDNASKIKFH